MTSVKAKLTLKKSTVQSYQLTERDCYWKWWWWRHCWQEHHHAYKNGCVGFLLSQSKPRPLNKVKVCRFTSWPRVSAASNSNGNKQRADSQWQWSECWLRRCIVSSLTSAVISHFGLLRILVQSSQSCSSKQFSHTHQFQDCFSLRICKRVMLSFTWEWWLTLHRVH